MGRLSTTECTYLTLHQPLSDCNKLGEELIILSMAGGVV